MLLLVSGKMQLLYFLNRMEDGEKEGRRERGSKKPRFKRSEMPGNLPIELFKKSLIEKRD
jgi:hypothetical protein